MRRSALLIILPEGVLTVGCVHCFFLPAELLEDTPVFLLLPGRAEGLCPGSFSARRMNASYSSRSRSGVTVSLRSFCAAEITSSPISVCAASRICCFLFSASVSAALSSAGSLVFCVVYIAFSGRSHIFFGILLHFCYLSFGIAQLLLVFGFCFRIRFGTFGIVALKLFKMSFPVFEETYLWA